MQAPRNTLTGTRAEHLLQREFFVLTLRARVLDGEDKTLADGTQVFHPTSLPLLGIDILDAPGNETAPARCA